MVLRPALQQARQHPHGAVVAVNHGVVPGPQPRLAPDGFPEEVVRAATLTTPLASIKAAAISSSGCHAFGMLRLLPSGMSLLLGRKHGPLAFQIRRSRAKPIRRHPARESPVTAMTEQAARLTRRVVVIPVQAPGSGDTSADAALLPERLGPDLIRLIQHGLVCRTTSRWSAARTAGRLTLGVAPRVRATALAARPQASHQSGQPSMICTVPDLHIQAIM